MLSRTPQFPVVERRGSQSADESTALHLVATCFDGAGTARAHPKYPKTTPMPACQCLLKVKWLVRTNRFVEKDFLSGKHLLLETFMGFQTGFLKYGKPSPPNPSQPLSNPSLTFRTHYQPLPNPSPTPLQAPFRAPREAKFQEPR